MVKSLLKCFTHTVWVVSALPALGQQAGFAEAKAQIDQYWAKRMTTCDGVSYLRNATGEWKALRNLRWTVTATPLTQADTLNGIQWMGSTSLVVEASRHWNENTGWQQWQQGIGFFDGVKLEVVKGNGTWSFQKAALIALMLSPRCSDVPPEVPRKTIQQVANEKAQAAPGLCRQYFSSSTNYGSVDSYIQQGLDPKACRGDGGITPLMAVALYCFDDAVQPVLAAGVDVNATDAKGQTALDYVTESHKRNATTSCYITLRMLNAAGARAGRRQSVQAPQQGSSEGSLPAYQGLAGDDDAARVKLRLVKQVPPEYTPLALQAKVQGDVKLLIKINEDGIVVAARLLSGHPLLVEAAKTAVSQYRYTMAVREVVSTTVTVKFRLPAESR